MIDDYSQFDGENYWNFFDTFCGGKAVINEKPHELIQIAIN